ncbi:reverse transcriptase domain-containing protein [Tanacetum coccineum]|uniref:Reverse transcriptase domain-containing protein n=1 Tax=Tanacetum coccineum TaxID=301880 RepID=A0ABQ5DZU1_9ASTR
MHSETMTEKKINYTTTEKEMLAVVYAFEKFRSYLIMNKSVVYIRPFGFEYNSSIEKSPKARLLRWVLTFFRNLILRGRSGGKTVALMVRQTDDALWAFRTAFNDSDMDVSIISGASVIKLRELLIYKEKTKKLTRFQDSPTNSLSPVVRCWFPVLLVASHPLCEFSLGDPYPFHLND